MKQTRKRRRRRRTMRCQIEEKEREKERRTKDTHTILCIFFMQRVRPLLHPNIPLLLLSIATIIGE
jgi:hypothetical protein